MYDTGIQTLEGALKAILFRETVLAILKVCCISGMFTVTFNTSFQNVHKHTKRKKIEQMSSPPAAADHPGVFAVLVPNIADHPGVFAVLVPNIAPIM